MQIIKANILNETNGIILHGCNASGGYGSGIAGQIRMRYQEAYEKFKLIPHGEDSMGKLQLVQITDELYIGNGITQLNFGNDGKRYASVHAIEKVLGAAFKWCSLNDQPLKTVKIGCGLGGLDWDGDVKPIFEEMIKEYPSVEVTIFEI